MKTKFEEHLLLLSYMLLNPGVFGGSVHEAMVDLIYMLNTLIDKDGK
jgi:hypothetical protein